MSTSIQHRHNSAVYVRASRSKKSPFGVLLILLLLIITSTKKHLKMNKEIGMMLPKKKVNTSGVGQSNNYYEDIYNIYLPPYNNTH